MDDKKREEVIGKMLKLSKDLQEELSTNNQEIANIGYYKDFRFKGTNLGINDAYVVKIKDDSVPDKDVEPRKQDSKDEGFLYQIYDKNSNLIATVNREGRVEFNPEFIEAIDKRYIDSLNLGNAEFESPQELGRDDLVLTREEIESSKTKDEKNNSGLTIEEQQEQQEPEQKESEEKKIAEEKGVPPSNVLKLRPDSNFYRDHPEVEENLYFYKGSDGIIRAEYIDENGNSQPSRFFEESTTAIREETVSMGDNGKPVVKETPYQVMETKNLNNVDKDIRGVRINVNIDSYGYLEISEARQGTNGMWSSHAIEVQGRDYNSHVMDRITSIETRKADPDKLTEAYKSVDGTKVAEDGIELSEMFLMQHAQELIQKFINEGYNKNEATEIFNLMIGEEKLTESQAKKEVNENIKNQSREKDSPDRGKDEVEIDDDDNQRTPWGDAEARRRI